MSRLFICYNNAAACGLLFSSSLRGVSASRVLRFSQCVCMCTRNAKGQRKIINYFACKVGM